MGLGLISKAIGEQQLVHVIDSHLKQAAAPQTVAEQCKPHRQKHAKKIVVEKGGIIEHLLQNQPEVFDDFFIESNERFEQAGRNKRQIPWQK